MLLDAGWNGMSVAKILYINIKYIYDVILLVVLVPPLYVAGYVCLFQKFQQKYGIIELWQNDWVIS